MASFCGLEFQTAPGRVMTPRRATEKLVDAAVELVGDRPYARVADVGTGSGAIAVALALRLPRAEIWASDISPASVALARRNAARHGVGDRIHMAQGDLLEPIPAPLCLVLANLPYLPDSLRGHPETVEYETEPPEAIFAPGEGLALYRRLLVEAESRLDAEGAIVVQFRRQILTAERSELPELLARLEARSVGGKDTRSRTAAQTGTRAKLARPDVGVRAANA